MTPEERQALNAYVEAVRRHYGARLHDICVFGSRARGDHHAESDVDLAVILRASDWEFWHEKLALADLSYDAFLDAGLDIQSWPIALSAWQSPSGHSQQGLIEAMKRDARGWREAA